MRVWMKCWVNGVYLDGWIDDKEWLMDICADLGLFVAKDIFQHKMIHIYMWRRGIQDEQKELINYMAVDKRLKADVMDGKVVRGMFEESDYYVVLMK